MPISIFIFIIIFLAMYRDFNCNELCIAAVQYIVVAFEALLT